MVDIPAPKPAQVIRYSYLWADEHEAGRDEGIKDRPVAIVLALQTEPTRSRYPLLSSGIWASTTRDPGLC
jgi:hypothetical protein